MRLTDFTHDFLLLFAGPLVWSVHFVALYGLNGLACARPGSAVQWLGWPWETWAMLGLGVLAAAALVACLRVRPRTGPEDSRQFVRWTSAALCGLALLAIAWESLAVLLVPGCAPAA